MESHRVIASTTNPALDAALDTLRMGKQALVFFSTRRSAEKGAEDIAKAVKKQAELHEGRDDEALERISHGIRTALSRPTKQCKRLAESTVQGIAFHHSGLAGKQRSLIEEGFRNGDVRIICATPTLAAGVDLPSFRTIIRDFKRFTNYGMQPIPVLEYLQMAGRSGRPSYDEYGECILISQSRSQQTELEGRYIRGEPEEITSKLAAEPALRTHLLALIANGVVSGKQDIVDFMSKTFYGQQYGNLSGLIRIVDKILHFLEEAGFVENSAKPNASSDADMLFTPASSLGSDEYRATTLGRRISELYLDPYSAHVIIQGVRNAEKGDPLLVSYVNLLCHALELRPYPTVRKKDYEMIESFLAQSSAHFIVDEPHLYSEAYDTYLQTVKLTMVFLAWLSEEDETTLNEEYDITPGHLYGKLDLMDWLSFASSEICAILKLPEQRKRFQKLRTLLKYGIGEELLPLVRIRNIGRVRARALYTHGIRNPADIQKAQLSTLSRILGEKLAQQLKTASTPKFDVQKKL